LAILPIGKHQLLRRWNLAAKY
jgi:hypothetical protein